MSITYHKSRDIQCLRQTTTTRDIEKENSLNEYLCITPIMRGRIRRERGGALVERCSKQEFQNLIN